jgi:hypothetical protein
VSEPRWTEQANILSLAIGALILVLAWTVLTFEAGRSFGHHEHITEAVELAHLLSATPAALAKVDSVTRLVDSVLQALPSGARARSPSRAPAVQRPQRPVCVTDTQTGRETCTMSP